MMISLRIHAQRLSQSGLRISSVIKRTAMQLLSEFIGKSKNKAWCWGFKTKGKRDNRRLLRIILLCRHTGKSK